MTRFKEENAHAQETTILPTYPAVYFFAQRACFAIWRDATHYNGCPESNAILRKIPRYIVANPLRANFVGFLVIAAPHPLKKLIKLNKPIKHQPLAFIVKPSAEIAFKPRGVLCVLGLEILFGCAKTPRRILLPNGFRHSCCCKYCE